MHIAKMNYSRLVAAYISLTLVGCLLAGVYAPPASADPVTDSDGNSDPLSGDEEQIDVNEEDVNDGKLYPYIYGELRVCCNPVLVHWIPNLLPAALRGVHYFGGDIILTPKQKAMIIEETSNPQQSSTDVRRRRAVQRNQSILWHNGKVPYVLDSSLSKLIHAFAYNIRITRELSFVFTLQVHVHEVPSHKQFKPTNKTAVSALCKERMKLTMCDSSKGEGMD